MPTAEDPNASSVQAPTSSVRLEPSIWVAIIGALPAIIGIVALTFVLLAYRTDVRRMLPGVRSVSAFGVSLSLGETAVAQWTADANKKRMLGITTGDLKASLARAENSQRAYAGVELLWVDDHPEFSFWEKRALRSLGARITTALSNSEATDLLRRNEYDLVISDIARDNGEDGRQPWRQLARSQDSAAVIYYVADLQPGNPDESFGITNRPDVLINLVTDALQRREFRLRGNE